MSEANFKVDKRNEQNYSSVEMINSVVKLVDIHEVLLITGASIIYQLT